MTPRSYLSPFQVAPSLAKGKGYMHLAGPGRKGNTYQFNNQQTHLAGLPPGCPHSPVGSLCCSTQARCSGGRREGGTVHSGSYSISLCPPLRASLQLWGASRPRPRPCPGPHSPPLLRQLTIAAVSELAVLSNLQFGGVGGGDAVTGLHAVPLFQLRESAHEAGVGSIQRGDALFLWAKRASVGHRMGSRLQRGPC